MRKCGVEKFLSFFKILRKLNKQKSISEYFKPVYQVNNQNLFRLMIRDEELRQKINNVTLHLFIFFVKKLFMYKNIKFCQNI